MATDNPYATPAPQAPADDGSTAPLEPPQSVSFTPLPEDHLAFVKHLNTTDATVRRVLRRRRIGWLVAGGVFFGLSFFFGPNGLNDPGLEVMNRVIGIGFIALGLITPVLARSQSKRQVARAIRLGMYGKFDEQVTVILQPDGVRTRDSDGDGVRYWSGLSRVAATDDYLFIYLQPAQAIPLPLRAFQSEAHFRGFAVLAEKLWQATQAGDASTDG